ncbi:MAG: ABC transporter permease subunit [Anaerolineae bacterium]|nr:ABC transporter permease subunit [Anaerolineae bacterium]
MSEQNPVPDDPAPEPPDVFTPSDDDIPPEGLYTRVILWAADLPWWAIILIISIVVVLYSMSTSIAYKNVTRWLTDDPQVKTDDLFDVVQVVGEPSMITGRFVGETGDSVNTVINELLESSIDSEIVTHTGFLVRETPATLTIATDDGGTVHLRKENITAEERTGSGGDIQITVNYVDRVTVTGTLVKQNDDMMRIRTVDEEIDSFDPARVISRTDNADGTITFERDGAVITGILSVLSNINITIKAGEDQTAEYRRDTLEWINVPTLTVAVNADANRRTIAPGDTVRVAFLQGTDIIEALDQLDSLDNVPVPLRYTDGSAQVSLLPYPDLETALAAVGAGEADGLVYLDAGPDRLAVAEWVEANPDAGVVMPDDPRECNKDCEVSFKRLDDTITGVILEEDADTITLQLVAPEYIEIDKNKIVENKRMEPGVCALNNLRGCNEGIFLTLRVTFQAYALALVIGLVVGLMRVQTNPTTIFSKWMNTVLQTISTLYVEIVRGIPLLVILLYAGFVISPRLRDIFGLNLSDEQEAVIGLAFGYGAFIAEIFRAGIQSIGRGQMEAARSLGMSYPQAMRYVILPQAVRVVLPPLGNDFIALLKDSALISVLALPDLLQLGRLYVSRTFRAFEGYNTVAIMYLMMTLFLSMMVRIIERRTRLPE